MNIIEAIDDPHLLGAAIRNAESWKPWRAFLAAAFGLPLDAYGAELFRQCTGRSELPSSPFSFAWLVCGRRGGKSFAMAVVAVYLGAFKDWRPRLSPGERAVILLVATDREQAKILRRYIGGILELPVLAQLVESETADSIELRNRLAIEVVTCSYRLVRGRSVCVALLDEAAFWRREDSANPDIEVLTAIRASMATFGDDAMMVIGSSPYARRGILWDAWRKYFGKPDAKNLVWQAPTRTMNPSVEQSFIDAEFERDSASAEAEYNAQFRSDIEAFISREAVEACVEPGVLERAPIANVRYVGFADPSGGSSDSMTLAIAHREGDAVILDAVRERKPPFSPDAVVTEFAALLKSYHIGSVRGDRYAGEWPREVFRKHEIEYLVADKTRSELYLAMLPLVMSRRADLLDNPKTGNQFVGLERRTARSGRDSIDHGPGQHDDLANAVAGALLAAIAPVQQVSFCAPIIIENPNSTAAALADAFNDRRSSGFRVKWGV
jgi:hypothetical protein